MFKVEYSRLAVLPDGSIGNVNQGNDVAYIDTSLEAIPQSLDNHLFEHGNKYKHVINKVTLIKGHIAESA